MKIHLIAMLLINKIPLTRQQRKHIPFHQVNQEFIEAKYETVLSDIPEMIDRARAVIIEDTAVRNMFGYTIALSFVIGATLETVGALLVQFESLQVALHETLSNLEYFGFFWYIWWYGFGDIAPWLFPDAFGTGGDPNLQCSSADFIRLVGKFNLDAGVAAINQMSTVQRFILLEKLERDLSEELGCVIIPQYPQRSYKEQDELVLQFQELTGLIRFHQSLVDESRDDPSEEELRIFDREILLTWEEIGVVTEQVGNL